MRLFRLNRKGTGTVLGPLENEVMQIVWAALEPVSVSDVHQSFLRKKKSQAYSTIKAILTNLSEKGYLKKRSQGRSNIFSAVVSRDKFQENVVNEVLNSLAVDYRNPLLTHLVDRMAADPETLEDLERLIARKRADLS